MAPVPISLWPPFSEAGDPASSNLITLCLQLCSDHNSIVAETIEAMQYPRKFFKAYVWGFW